MRIRLASLFVFAAALVGCAGADGSRVRSLPGSAMPYLGVRCPGPNSIACDRVGIGVELARPAVGVMVQIAGRLVKLSPPRGGDDLWEGSLWHAGLRNGPLAVHIPSAAKVWIGDPPVNPRVRVTVFFADGTIATLSGTDSLHAGYG